MRSSILASFVSLVAAAGCNFNPDANAVGSDGAGLPDAAIDGPVAPPDASVDASPIDAGPEPDAQSCLGDELPFVPLNIAPCDVSMPAAAFNLNEIGTYTLDTDTGTLTPPVGSPQTLSFSVVTQADGPQLFVLSTEGFAVGATARLTVTGARPLLIIAFGDINISGALSVAGRSTAPGAGGDVDVICASGRGSSGVVQQDDNGNDGGSGGGGGGFGDPGGEGARVDDAAAGMPTAGGLVSTNTDLVPLRGGCSGGAGGNTTNAGGGGGGAVQLIASNDILVSGSLSASGGGGPSAASQEGGGAGGGSGGGILLQASSIDISGSVTANGGGGGEGTRGGGSADPGNDGSETTIAAASGGAGLSSGGDGGNGGVNGVAAQDGSEGNQSGGTAAGGGGGGGAVGRIRFVSVTPATVQGGAVVSPTAN